MSVFRLLPFEHRGVTPAPHGFTHAVFAGAEREIWFKRREGKIYFRLASEREVAPTFGTWGQREDLSLDFLRAAIETEHYGRLETCGKLNGLMLITALMRDENGIVSGEAREWCGGEWLRFETASRNSYNRAPGGALIPHWRENGWHKRDLLRALKPLATEFVTRPFSPFSEELRWIRGSEAEFAEVTRHLSVFLPRTRWASFNHFSSWGKNNTAATTFWASWSLKSTSVPVAGGVNCPHTVEIFDWGTVINRQFQVVGLNCESLNRIPSGRRFNFKLGPFNISSEHQVSVEPTAHERLESLLFLANWAREKGERPKGLKV